MQQLEVSEMAEPSVWMFVSAAGFSASARSDFLRTLRDVLPDVFGDCVAAAGAANDGVSLLLAYEASIAVIAGTGSIALVRTAEGIRQVGGHDWVACDQGSGFWIGMRSIRQAYRDLDEGSDSVLLQRLYEHFGLSPDDEDRLIAKAYDLALAQSSMKREIAEVCRLGMRCRRTRRSRGAGHRQGRIGRIGRPDGPRAPPLSACRQC